MARIIQAVIGANYGDEGKGRTVDYLTSKAASLPLIVRHNSGAQAGHTVVRDGKRHVFSHFGSGTLLGAPTLLGPKFVVHPLIFNQEWDELVELGIKPQVFADPNCMVSTPYDAMLNQLTEVARGTARHGSCGYGFGETIARYERLGERARSLFQESLATNAPDYNGYYAEECERRGLGRFSREPEWINFKQHVAKMCSRLGIIHAEAALRTYEHLIFEGAQGLLLHQDHPNFPHVTRCRTGLEDVVELLGMSKIEGNLEAFYVTRTYLTRHGAGPFPRECSALEMKGLGYDVIDNTNYENPHQGALRFAELDSMGGTLSVVMDDVADARSVNRSIRVQPNLAINHLTHAPSRVVEQLISLNETFVQRCLLGWSTEGASTEEVGVRTSARSRRVDPTYPVL